MNYKGPPRRGDNRGPRRTDIPGQEKEGRHRTLKRSWFFSRASVADYLTASRGLISLALFLFIPMGIKSIGLGTVLYIAGWTTDILDGRLARAGGNEGGLAKWDFPLDMILTGAGAAYCAYLGIIPGLFFWIWGILWLLLAIITRNQAVIMLTAFVCHVVSGVGLAKASPLWFWVLVAWIVLVLALDFRRFGQVVVGFISSAGDWLRR